MGKITEYKKWEKKKQLRTGDKECECCGGIIAMGQPDSPCEECYDNCEDGISCFDGRVI
jgi:hypothetical protein